MELNPDVIFYNGMLSREAIAGSACYKTTNAGKAGAIYEISPENLERQSPDLLDTLWTMGTLLYPRPLSTRSRASPGRAPRPRWAIFPPASRSRARHRNNRTMPRRKPRRVPLPDLKPDFQPAAL